MSKILKILLTTYLTNILSVLVRKVGDIPQELVPEVKSNIKIILDIE